MAKKKDVVTRAEAKKLMWEYYRDNKGNLPKWIGEFREEILGRIESGCETISAFEELVNYVTTRNELESINP
jgi:hypothetical protein